MAIFFPAPSAPLAKRLLCLASLSAFLLAPPSLQAAGNVSSAPAAKENTVHAAGQDLAGLNARLETILKNETTRSQAVQDGKKASFFCANCHGMDGNSKFPEVPNLAAQNPSYLLSQILKFRTGQRRNAFMERLVKELSANDLVNISVYFSSTAVGPKAASNTAQVATGKTLFTQTCQQCHGPSAHGNGSIPRLAGQHAEYLTLSLGRYRTGDGQRMDSQMQAVARQLTDDQIGAVAAYLSRQQ